MAVTTPMVSSMKTMKQQWQYVKCIAEKKENLIVFFLFLSRADMYVSGKTELFFVIGYRCVLGGVVRCGM